MGETELTRNKTQDSSGEHVEKKTSDNINTGIETEKKNNHKSTDSPVVSGPASHVWRSTSNDGDDNVNESF